MLLASVLAGTSPVLAHFQQVRIPTENGTDGALAGYRHNNGHVERGARQIRTNGEVKDSKGHVRSEVKEESTKVRSRMGFQT